jgi:hypothetical protein
MEETGKNKRNTNAHIVPGLQCIQICIRSLRYRPPKGTHDTQELDHFVRIRRDGFTPPTLPVLLIRKNVIPLDAETQASRNNKVINFEDFRGQKKADEHSQRIQILHL